MLSLCRAVSPAAVAEEEEEEEEEEETRQFAQAHVALAHALLLLARPSPLCAHRCRSPLAVHPSLPRPRPMPIVT
jgi:hypothetical protein